MGILRNSLRLEDQSIYGTIVPASPQFQLSFQPFLVLTLSLSPEFLQYIPLHVAVLGGRSPSQTLPGLSGRAFKVQGATLVHITKPLQISLCFVPRKLLGRFYYSSTGFIAAASASLTAILLERKSRQASCCHDNRLCRNIVCCLCTCILRQSYIVFRFQWVL